MSAAENFLSRRQLMLASLLSAGLNKAFAQSSGNVSRIIVPFAAGGAREMPAPGLLSMIQFCPVSCDSSC